MKKTTDNRRVARVESEVLRIVAQYIIQNMKGELPGIVTVSRVQMPADLRVARVYLSIINFEGKFSEVLKILEERSSEIQQFINKNLRMRYCPKLQFFEDEVTQKVLKIENILKDLANEKKNPSDE